jgi:hypothetical protein
MENNICLLCEEESNLIKQSHIIPNFMYRGLFDDDNRMALASFKNEKTHFIQTGFFDKYILCQKCDNGRIGKLEKYAAEFIYGDNHNSKIQMKKLKGIDGVRSIGVNNIDYRAFKLFILSILWRAHISKNPFFKKIDLGRDGDIIKDMLLNTDAKHEEDYRISILAVKGANDHLVRVVPDPELSSIEGKRFATFFINGFAYFIAIDADVNFALFKLSYLKHSGEIEIPIVDGEVANRLLKAFGLSEEIANYFA